MENDNSNQEGLEEVKPLKTLPHEVLTLIFGETYHRGGARVLANNDLFWCLTVYKNWTQPAKDVLYSHINITNLTAKRIVDKFLDGGEDMPPNPLLKSMGPFNENSNLKLYFQVFSKLFSNLQKITCPRPNAEFYAAFNSIDDKFKTLRCIEDPTAAPIDGITNQEYY